MDWDKEDHGKNDGVLWIISISQIIKEINSSDGRFNRAMCENPGERLTAELMIVELLAKPRFSGGLYAIPDNNKELMK